MTKKGFFVFRKGANKLRIKFLTEMWTRISTLLDFHIFHPRVNLGNNSTYSAKVNIWPTIRQLCPNYWSHTHAHAHAHAQTTIWIFLDKRSASTASGTRILNRTALDKYCSPSLLHILSYKHNRETATCIISDQSWL